jgi:hypothetical protein
VKAQALPLNRNEGTGIPETRTKQAHAFAAGVAFVSPVSFKISSFSFRESVSDAINIYMLIDVFLFCMVNI